MCVLEGRKTESVCLCVQGRKSVLEYFCIFFFFFQATATLSRKMPGEGGACRNSVVESKLR